MEVQHHPSLHTEFEASRGSMTPCQKQNNLCNPRRNAGSQGQKYRKKDLVGLQGAVTTKRGGWASNGPWPMIKVTVSQAKETWQGRQKIALVTSSCVVLGRSLELSEP